MKNRFLPQPPPDDLQERIMWLFAAGDSLDAIATRLQMEIPSVKKQLVLGCKRAGLCVMGKHGPLRRMGITAWFGTNVTMADEAFQ